MQAKTKMFIMQTLVSKLLPYYFEQFDYQKLDTLLEERVQERKTKQSSIDQSIRFDKKNYFFPIDQLASH